MVDTVAVVSVVASSLVALVSVGAQVWLSRLNLKSERRSWLRDRRTEAYLGLLTTMRTYNREVTDAEWVAMSARVSAFASRPIAGLFNEWQVVTERALADGLSAHDREMGATAQDEAAAKLEAAVAAELQS